MSASPFRCRGDPDTGYDVDERATGTLLGDVRQREQRYNLRRVYVTRWWEARTPDRKKITDEYGNAVQFATRTAAAEALLEAATLPRTHGGDPSQPAARVQYAPESAGQILPGD